MEFYQWIHPNILPVLEYWRGVYAAKQENNGSKSVRFEAAILEAMLAELRRPETPGLPVEKLVGYLVDDQLIKHEMERLVTQGVSNYEMDIDTWIHTRLDEMKATVSLLPGQTDEDIKAVRRIFMRRDRFIYYLDQQRGLELRKSKLEFWLEDRRKKAKIHIGYM